MSTRSLIFDIFAVDRASAVFSKVGTEAEATGRKVESTGMKAGKALNYLGIGAIAAGAYAVKSAADFQTLTTKLVTTAGESRKNLATVSAGLLDMAGKVGYTADQLATGMYTVESAGFHGAQGLKVMTAAAKGARIEGADLTDVTNAVSSALVDYHLSGVAAARVTNTLVAATGRGKTTFQDMAEAIPNVGAAGASAHIKLDELATAIATMTQHGTAASKAGTYLRQVIGELEAPTAKAAHVMADLGVNANTLSQTLSSGSGHGLADAIKMLDDAIAKHTNAKGLVDLTNAAPGTKKFKDAVAGLPGPIASAFGALSNMVGGVRSLQGFLQLGGENLKTYNKNLAGVRHQVQEGGSDVEGYAEQQATFNGQLHDAAGYASAFAVKLGNDLLPQATGFVSVLKSSLGFLEKNKTLTTGLADAIVGLGAAFLIYKVATASMKAYAVAMALVKGLQIAWIAATQGMTAAQVALNVAEDANPIGAIILLIAALVAGLIYAYKNSETFRNIVNGAFKAVGDAAKFMWNDVLRPTFKFIVDTFLGVAGAIVNGAAKAFGWVPGLGSKLKAAAAWFNTFAARVNASLAGIHDKTVTLSVITEHSVVNKVNHQLGTIRGATGGIVTQPTYALIGEAGPEAVIPLNRAPGASPLGAGGPSVVINVNGALDPVAVGKQIVQHLNAYGRTQRKPIVQVLGA